VNTPWRLYRFDYTRYLELRPSLRSATTPAAFAAIADSPETCAIADALFEDEITLTDARRAFIETACCVGEPLVLDRNFARFVSAIGHRRGAEDAAELLSELLAGSKNLEPWMLPAVGLIGFLTPQETTLLSRSYAVVARRGRLGRRGKRRRRGGLLGVCVGFLRRLFDRDLPDDEMLLLLGDQIAEAEERGEGLAVVAA
jgi:hypothetical protein